MPSIHITNFSGLNTKVASRLLPNNAAQVAHNCILLDGDIRPTAKWGKILSQTSGPPYIRSITIAPDGGTLETTPLWDAVYARNSSYSPSTKVGLLYPSEYSREGTDGSNNVRYSNSYTASTGTPAGLYVPNGSVGITYTRQYHSNKPVARAYAFSGVRINVNGTHEESPLLVLQPASYTSVYEGDTAGIVGDISNPDIATGARPYDTVRIYRAISGMDTGTAVFNELDTEWMLVAELPILATGGTFNYVDDGIATHSSLDVYLAGRFYSPAPNTYSRVQLLEGGWFAIGAADGTVCVSERYFYHAWPTENVWSLPGETIVCMKAHIDGIFIGTQSFPYMLAISAGEALGVQGAVTQYPEKYRCLTDSMDSTPSGAIYASDKGVVTLTREGMELASANVAKQTAPLYRIPVQLTVSVYGQDVLKTVYFDMRFEHTIHGMYYLGKYIGFCKVNSKQDGTGADYYAGYIYTLGSTLDGDDPLEKLTTFDTPGGAYSHSFGNKGIYVLSDDGVYSMPFPGANEDRYNRTVKNCYTWKSKKFVFPGNMVMAAAKIVHDCAGTVRLKLYVDCCCAYEVAVEDCLPFTLPPNMAGVEWEVEVHGTAVIHEIHIASSLRELLE